MAISGVSSVSSATDTDLPTSQRKVTKELDQNAFLKLLCEKLQNQDPMNPSQDTEFLSELAQYTSLQQMQQVNASTSLQAAFNLIGKTIKGVDIDGSAVTGKVDSVTSVDSTVSLNIGGQSVKLSNVTQVLPDTTTTNTTNGTDGSNTASGTNTTSDTNNTK